MLQDPAACHKSVAGCSLRTVLFAKGNIALEVISLRICILMCKGENCFSWPTLSHLQGPVSFGPDSDFTQRKAESMEFHQHKPGEQGTTVHMSWTFTHTFILCLSCTSISWDRVFLSLYVFLYQHSLVNLFKHTVR